jgi:hypothetical protein
VIEKRPTETVTGLALAASIFGFLTQAGVSQAVAAIVAVALAFVPAALSAVVDALRRPARDNVASIESGKGRKR